MRMRAVTLVVLLATVALALVAGACGSDDDGSDVRAVGTDASAGSGSGSGSASGTGLSGSDLATIGTDDPLVQSAVAEYSGYVSDQTDEIIARTTVFTDAVRAGNLAAARAAFAESREPWEAIEPIAGLVPDIDGAVDARVDDFSGPNDPAWTGWHRLEYLLWEKNTTAGGKKLADRLDADLASLESGLGTLEIPPAAVALGAAELIQEVSEGKITGEEDRYSKTDLWDFQANVDGAKQVITTLTPALEAADPALVADIQQGFTELQAELDTLKEGYGFVLYCQQDDPFPSDLCTSTTVTPQTIDQLKVLLAGLSEDLALVPGALGLS